MQYRTHYCGDVDTNLLNTEIKLCGWVHRIRNLGGLIFIDLRDREGLVQIVIEPEKHELIEIAKNLHNEWVIAVSGLVRNRPGAANENLKSGALEVVAKELTILNPAKVLPFPINESQEISEELRLSHRYLDLRRPEMIKNLLLRANITKAMRHFLDAEGFIEVETPILTKSTPEGARDYLVPSRVHPGSFYALPQSPQIFKQLLMVSGLDRYYQLARCFRDEDLRADRQPEFTQLDIEMSFIEPAQIQALMEKLMQHIFKEVLEVELPASFPHLTYKEAMAKYGSDKPDLRIPLELVEIKDLVKDSELGAFRNAANDPHGRVVALRVPGGNTLSRSKCDAYVELVGNFGLKGLSYLKVNDLALGINGLQSSLLKFLSEEAVTQILKRTDAKTGDMIFFAAGNSEIVNTAMGTLRIKVGKDLNIFDDDWRFLWVVDFPMFERKEDGNWTSVHHPFTSPIVEDPVALEKDPGATLAKAYDLVLNGFELGGGSIRISNSALQQAVFRILSIDEKTAENRFGHLLNALQYGCPPHGGIALGLDRIAMLMAKVDSLRDVIPFPKTLAAFCPLTGAPSSVSEAQLRELKIAAASS